MATTCTTEIFADIELRTRKLDYPRPAAVSKLALAAGKVGYRRAVERTDDTIDGWQRNAHSKIMIAAAFGVVLRLGAGAVFARRQGCFFLRHRRKVKLSTRGG